MDTSYTPLPTFDISRPYPSSSRWRVATAALCLLTAVLALLLLSGCTTASAMATTSEAKPSIDPNALLAEALIEGPSTDADGSAFIGRTQVYLVGKVAQDFNQIHAAAVRHGDDELAVAAALALVCLAPAHEQDAGWQLVGSCIAQTDTGLAVALARRRTEFVNWLERRQRRGLQPGSHVWRAACTARAGGMINEGSRRYSAAQGWFDDDEEEIAVAMVRFREAYDLMAPNGLSVDASIRIRDGIGMCESDLWASQAASANAAYGAQIDYGEQRLRSIMLRLGSALEYTQQVTQPSFGQTEQISFGGSR